MAERMFELIDGTSKKFWAVSQNGVEFTTRWGRIGTGGQSKTKACGSDTAAASEVAKLIAEKTGKGYTEIGSPSAAPVPTTPAPQPKAKTATEPVSEPSATVTTSPAASALTVENRIELSPADYAVVRSRKEPDRPVLPRFDAEPIRPFDREGCLAQVAAGMISSKTKYWWAKFDPNGMSRQEAHFWFDASVHMSGITPPDVARKIQNHTHDGSLTGIAAGILLQQTRTWLGHYHTVFLASAEILFPPVEFVEFLLSAGQPVNSYQINEKTIEWFETRILPRMTDAERTTAKELVTAALRAIDPKTLASNEYSLALELASPVGASEELQTFFDALPEYFFGTSSNYFWHSVEKVGAIIMSLNGPAVERTYRRQRLPIQRPEVVRGLIAHTGANMADFITDAIINSHHNKGDVDKLIAAFAKIVQPSVAPHMLRLKLESKAPTRPREWMDDHPGTAIAGLIPTAAGTGKLAEAAREYLIEMAAKGHTAFIESQLAGQPENVVSAVRTLLNDARQPSAPEASDADLPVDLLKELNAVQSKPKKLPSWADPTLLPPLTVGGQGLSAAHLSRVLQVLAVASPTLDPLLAAVRKHADSSSRDTFCWKLFERWQQDGCPPKEKWAFLAMGAIGGDGCALKITPKVREWPGESQHARAVVGLEVLRRIGSDTALMQLNGIAQKLKFQGLKKKAQEFMEAIAKDRGFTRTELEDRIVPDLDLDAQGGRTFDFGPRQFRVLVGPDLTPVVRMPDGAIKSDLPKPGKTDDATKASEAVTAWKLLKKLLKETLKIQAPRLEAAMITSRRWTPTDFDTLLVRHPLMINVVRRLVWAGYDASGKRLVTFRVNEEGELADSDDRPTALDGVTHVGIVHPLHLTDQEKATWGQVFSDYEILPPFPQLGRAVNRLTPAELQDNFIHRHMGTKVNPLTLVGILEKTGWTRGRPADAGLFCDHTKHFPAAKMRAVLVYEHGIPIGYMDGWEDQTLTRCYFLPESTDVGYWPNGHGAVPLAAVDPVAISEVLSTLHVLHGKSVT